MLLRVPYNFPGKVKQITTKGDSSEVILALDDSSLEISVLIAATAMADLALKNGVPAYAAIMWLNGAIPPDSGKKMVTVQAGNNTWVTIPRGPATEAEIIAAREKVKIDHGHPSMEQEKVWSFGYLTPDAFSETTQKILWDFRECAPGSSLYQIETIRYPDGTWATIPYSTECEAKIRNAQEKYKNTVDKPSGDLEAWSHGYSSLEAYSQAFGSTNAFRVNGPSIAGFIHAGVEERPDLFASSGLSVGKNAWPVPVNIYNGPDKIGQAHVSNVNKLK